MKSKVLKKIAIMSKYAVYGMILQTVLCTLIFASEGEAQRKSLDEILVSVELKNLKIEEAFSRIEEITEFDFAYKRSDFDTRKRISLAVQNQPMTELLLGIARETGLQFKRIDETINVSRAFEQTNLVSELLAVVATASEVEVTGRVTDNGGNGLPGVNVLIKGTSTGTVTDFDGNYKLLAEDNATLVFSFVGYKTAEVAIGGRTSISVTLDDDIAALEEIVVVGYGEQKKVSVTNAVAQVNGEELTKRPVSSIQQSLQGQAAGLTVLDQGGSPGRTATTMRVRGITTLGNKNDALVIVDGVEQQLTNINPGDIESVSILKDAASTAIYGSRAANGVILITTKRAKEGKVTVDYSTYYALQNSVNNPKMDMPSYMKLQQVAYENAGLVVPQKFTDQGIDEYLRGNKTDPEKFPHVNEWYKVMLYAAPQFNHNLAVSGGSETFKARMSMRYMKQNSILDVPIDYGSNLRDVRVNSDFKASENLTFSTDLNYRSNYSLAPVNEANVFDRFIHGSLFATPKYEDGTYGLSTQGNNPLMFAEQQGTSKLWNENIFGSAKAQWKIVDHLTFSSQLAMRIDNIRRKDFTNAFSNTDKNTNITRTVVNNSLTEIRDNSTEYTWNNLLLYDNAFGNHEVKALLGYSTIDNAKDSLRAYRERFYNNDIQSIGQGADDGTKTNYGVNSQFGLRSYFSRVNYSYNDRYLLEMNARYDGSSRFTGSNQYSFFPSFSGGWRISEEDFMQGIVPLDEFKLRASWGKTGNQTVGLYSYYQSLFASAYTFNGVSVIGFQPTTISNRDITWETTTQTDIGFDAQVFGGFTVALDYYFKRTEGILLNLPIPATIGLGAPPQNAGVVDNKGVELQLGYRNAPDKALRYNTTLNISANRNNVVSLSGTGPYITGSDINPLTIIDEGLPINSQWGYKTDGLFQTQEEVDSYPNIGPNRGPGDVKYVDINNDGLINASDRVVIGKSFPDFVFALNGNVSYKNFELNLLLQGASGVDTRLAGGIAENGNNEGFVPEIVSKGNYWTSENTDARFPRPYKRDLLNMYTSDRMIIDGSYLRLKNVQLLYNLPDMLVTKMRMTRANVYVSATNLFTISKLNQWGLDPEVGNGRATYYPQVSLWTLGANIQF
tara:strand:- start:101006 stop:104377 length:3372 start_codon:yes stop_codon:yes gene_type:complete